jgi:N-acetylmuramoyl-L-alanine amidase
MKIDENSHLVIEDGENFNIRFDQNPNVSGKQQVAERILVIHAPVSRDLNDAVQNARSERRSSHVIVGKDGREIVQTVPFNVGARHTPGKDGSSIAIELQYPGELSETGDVRFKLKSGFKENTYILGSALNNSRYGYWPLFPTMQLDSLLKIITALKKVYEITDVVAAEEILETIVHPGPALPIIQLRERLLRQKLLNRSGRSLVLQETSRAVQLLGQPDRTKEANTLLSGMPIPQGTPVFVINERFEWYLIAVMAEVNGNPWLMGWVEKDAVQVNTDFVPVVNKEHFLETSDGRRFQHILPHKNGFDASPLMEGEKAPKFIIMHYTTGTKIESTINHFKNPSSKVCTHLLIGRDGRVVQFLPFNIRAHHSGFSWWETENNLNRFSIGIELDNAGKLKKRTVEGRDVWMSRKIIIPDDKVEFRPHWKNQKITHAWERFPDVQLEVARKIVKALKERYDSLKEILGHDDVNLLNREDPGPLFPMPDWRQELFGRRQPVIKKLYLGKQTAMISNYNGSSPNESTKLHTPSILPADSEVIVSGEFNPDEIWTQIIVKQPKKVKALKNQRGWVKTNSLTTVEEDKGKKRKKKNQPARLKTKTTSDQLFYRTGGGQPTPPVPGSPFQAGTRVRKQEERGKWTLVVVRDIINGETGFEGWVNSGLLSKKPIPKSTRSISGVPPGLPLWQHMDDHELGKDRPHPGDPAVFLFEESAAARVDLTKEWQFFIRAINYKMPPDKVSAIFGNLKAFCNHTGLGDAAHPRADFIQSENLNSPLPQLDKVRTCALSVMTGVVEGEHLVVEMMNGSQPPPLKPGRVQPQRIEEIDPDAYLFTPWSDRYLFFAANRSVRGGRETKPFAHGALYDYTLDGRPYTWLPHVKPAGLKVRYPLSRLHRLPPNSEIPSPYKP